MLRFPRVVRLDSSDAQVFERAAAPGEWAVTGSFAFAERPAETLDSKARLAFRSGWLGCESFGWASLVEVDEISEAAFFEVVERLARHFVEHYGAPDIAAALLAARREADDAAALSDHKIHQLLAIEREAGPEGIIERIHLIHPDRATAHARIWQVVADGESEEETSQNREEPPEAENQS